MKITKFPQSCLLIETKGKKLLVDPGNLKYDEKYLEKWKEADAIFITHKHPDHFNREAIEILEENIPIYTTKEVQDTYPDIEMKIVKEGDQINIGEIIVEVVHAIHGYHPMLKGEKEIHENVGYIIDDG